MRRIKTILAAAIAVLVLGMVGSSAAQAGTGDGEFTIDVPILGTQSCEFTFDTDGWSGDAGTWSTDISNLTPTESCELPCFEGSGTVSKDSEGNAEFSGDLDLCIQFSFLGQLQCAYDLYATGSWAWDDPNQTYKRFTFDQGTLTYLSGSVLCPGSSFSGPASFGLSLGVSYP